MEYPPLKENRGMESIKVFWEVVHISQMICFEILTGRVALEDIQEKMMRNTRTRERLLLPFTHQSMWQAWQSCLNKLIQSTDKFLIHLQDFPLCKEVVSDEVWPQPNEFASLTTVTSRMDLTELSLPGKFCSDWLILFQMFAHKVTEKEESNISRRANSGSVRGMWCSFSLWNSR